MKKPSKKTPRKDAAPDNPHNVRVLSLKGGRTEGKLHVGEIVYIAEADVFGRIVELRYEPHTCSDPHCTGMVTPVVEQLA